MKTRVELRKMERNECEKYLISECGFSRREADECAYQISRETGVSAIAEKIKQAEGQP